MNGEEILNWQIKTEFFHINLHGTDLTVSTNLIGFGRPYSLRLQRNQRKESES